MGELSFESFDYPCDPLRFKIAGTDEAGRGPLCGNVVAACVVLDHRRPLKGLNDSKKLSAARREALYQEIRDKAVAVGIGMCTPQEIDTMNILRAALEAMRRAYLEMHTGCEWLLIDGNQLTTLNDVRQICVVGGDARVPEIAAASIVAKVVRDRQMLELDAMYPEYGFAAHKGYPTKEHLERLQRLPVLSCYRRSFAPVRLRIACPSADGVLRS